MALRYAILTGLVRGPASGYELAHRMDKTVGFAWKSTHQQIYKELGKMADEGLVEFDAVRQNDRPSKKLYRITESGRAALQEWVRTPTPLPPYKDPFLIKIFAGHMVDRDDLLEIVAQERAAHEAMLATYRDIDHYIHSLPEQQQDETVWFSWLALRRGITSEEAWLSWCDELEAHLALAKRKT